MKKFLKSASMVAAVCVAMSSCLKNDTPDIVPPIDPVDQNPELLAFIDSTGYNLVTQSGEYHYYYVDPVTGDLEEASAAAPYLYFEVLDEGDNSDGTTVVPISELGGQGSKDVTIYNNYSDTTLGVWVSYKGQLLNGTVFDETKDGKAVGLFLPALVPAWGLLLSKVSAGGHIRILTPAAYGYGNRSNQLIPANSPLFFDITVKGFIKNELFNY